MMTNKFPFLRAVMMVLFAALSVSMAAQTAVTGVVLEPDGIPAIGATVMEKGSTTNGAATDLDGNFSLQVSSAQATLVVSYVGMDTQEVPLNGQTNVTITLKSSDIALDELVVVGYGTMKKKDLTGAVSSVKMSDEPIRSIQESYDGFVAGIDWGGGGVMGTSRTTLHIYAYVTSPARYTCVFGRIYDEGEPSRHVEDIARILLRYNCDAVYGDHGGGNFAMSQLRQLVSGAMQVVPVMYSEASSPLKWNEAGKFFTANRTTVIDEFFADMQRNLIHAYNWEEFRPSAKDILNIRQVYIGEEIGKPRRVWRHSQQAPDDSLHSMVFGWIGCRVITGRLDFTGNAG